MEIELLYHLQSNIYYNEALDYFLYANNRYFKIHKNTANYLISQV